jgi:cell division protein FtsB
MHWVRQQKTIQQKALKKRIERQTGLQKQAWLEHKGQGIQVISDLVERSSDWLYRSRRRIATGAVVVLTCLVAFHVVLGANGIFVYQKKRTEFRALDVEIQSMQQENERLNQRIKSLRTDPKTIEKEAREQLKYARPGEVIYALPAERPSQNTTNTAKKQ